MGCADVSFLPLQPPARGPASYAADGSVQQIIGTGPYRITAVEPPQRLLLEPVFLLADEPSSRLDLITQQEIIALLVEQARERNCALLLIGHDRAVIEKTADRVVTMEPAAEP